MDKYELLFRKQFEAIDRKKALIEQKVQEKKDYLDPTWKFNVNNTFIQDADTVKTAQQDWLRFKGWDSYETDPKVYLDRPNKLAVHRRSYAAAYGVDPEDVSINDLLEAGKAQKQIFKQKLLEAADPQGNISYKRRGVDQEDGHRVLAELTTEGKQGAFLQDVTSRFEDAGYSGKFNFMRELEDFRTGDTAAHLAGSGDRSWGQLTTDSIANTVRGALQIVNDLSQTVTVLSGTNTPGVDKFFANNRDRLEAFKQYFNSPQQLRRERLAGEKRSRIAEPLFEVRKKEYMGEGSTEGEAKFKAGLFEAADTIVDLIEQPGRILDGFFESLPYMLGVGVGGKIVLSAAEKGLAKQVLKGITNRSAKAGVVEAPEILAAQARETAKAFIVSKPGQAYMKKVSERTGVALVGLTEGLTNAADTYSSILTMSETEGQNSQNYRNLRAKGMSHEQAAQKLAQEGFWGTWGLMTFIAGAISKVTGAAGFESRIFSRLADGKKALAVPGIAAKAAGLSKAILDPSLRETVEESVQSGAGEFLTQLAQFDATGKPVGAGIGAATAEGGVLGFASGGGVAVASKGGKAILRGAAKGTLALIKQHNPKLDPADTLDPAKLFNISARNDPNNPEDGSYPGGSKVAAYNKVKAMQESDTAYDPQKSYQDSVAAFKTSLGDNTSISMIQHFNELEVHYNNQEHTGKALTPTEEQEFQDIKGEYINTLNKAATNILAKKDQTEYDPILKSVINEAAFRGLGAVTELTEEDIKTLPALARKAITEIRAANTTLDRLVTRSQESSLIESEATGVPVKDIIQVNAEKLEDLVSIVESKTGGHNKTVLGLKAHGRVMLEQISRGDAKGFIQEQNIVGNFIKTQEAKLKRLGNLLTAVATNDSAQITALQESGEFKYVPKKGQSLADNSLSKLYNSMQAEMQDMKIFQSDMARTYQAWHGRKNSTIANLAKDVSAQFETPVTNSQKVTSNAAANRASQDAEADAAASQEADTTERVLAPETAEQPGKPQAQPEVAEAGEGAAKKGTLPKLTKTENVVTTKEDKNGNTYSYIASTSSKNGVVTTKFTFHRSDKAKEQRNAANNVSPEIAFKDNFIPESGSIPKDLKIVGVKEIRTGESGSAATVVVADESGVRTTLEIKLTEKVKVKTGKTISIKEAAKETYAAFILRTEGRVITAENVRIESEHTGIINAKYAKKIPTMTYHGLRNLAERHRERIDNYDKGSETYENMGNEISTAEFYADLMDKYSGGELSKLDPPAVLGKATTPEQRAAQTANRDEKVNKGELNRNLRSGNEVPKDDDVFGTSKKSNNLINAETLHWAHSQFGLGIKNDITRTPVLFAAAIIIGTEAIYQGAKDFVEFSVRMLDELGEYWRKLNDKDQKDIYKLAGEQTNSLLDNEGDPLQLRNNIDPSLPENTTNGFKVFGDVRTNSEQDKAIVRILDFFKDKDQKNKWFTLIGRGGTGKTTIIGKTIELLKEENENLSVTFYAPKNKAANVLERATGEKVYTVSQGLGKINVNVNGNYEFLQSEAKLKKVRDKIEGTTTKTHSGAIMLGKHLIIIDEASQLSEKDLTEIAELVEENPKLNTKVIFMGDNAQLPPIRPPGSRYIGKDSRVFTKIKAVLKFRMRQGKDSPIPALTDVVADNALSDTPIQRILTEEHRVSNFKNEKNSGVIFTTALKGMWEAWKKDFTKNPANTKLLTYNSATGEGQDNKWSVKLLNAEARRILWGEKGEFLNKNESLVFNSPTKTINIKKEKEQILPTSEEIIVTELLTPVSGPNTKKITGRIEYEEIDINNTEEIDYVKRAFYIKGQIEVVSVIGEIEGEKFAFDIPTPAGEEQLKIELKEAPWQDRAAMRSYFANYQYGYAITSHIAQGSTYRNVYVFEDNILNRNRVREGTLENLYKEQNQSLYVAMSRPSHKLVMVSEGNFTDNQEDVNFDEQEGGGNRKPLPDIEDTEDFTVLTNEELSTKVLQLQEEFQDNVFEIDEFVRYTGDFKLVWANAPYPDTPYTIHSFNEGVFYRSRKKDGKLFKIEPKDAINAPDERSQKIGYEMQRLSSEFNLLKSELKRIEKEVEKRKDPDYVSPNLKPTVQKPLVYPAAQARLDAVEELKTQIAGYTAEETTTPQTKTAASTLNIWAGANENKILSNLAPREFTFKGKTYRSVEHAYQSWKSGKFDKETYDKYLTSNQAKIQGNKGTDNTVTEKMMKVFIKASFEQNPEALAALLETGEAEFTHNAPNGRTDHWTTQFPVLLTEVRNELKQEQETATPQTKTLEDQSEAALLEAQAEKVDALDVTAEKQQAIEEKLQTVTDKTAASDVTFKNQSDGSNLNGWFQSLTKSFTAQEALQQMHTIISKQVTTKKTPIVEKSKFQTVLVDPAKTVISNIDKDEGSEAITQKILDKTVDIEKLVQEQPKLFRNVPGVKTNDFNSYSVNLTDATILKTLVERVKVAFKKAHVPLSAKEFLTVKSAKTKSLFSAARNVIFAMSTDDSAKKQLYKAMNITPEQKTGFERYLKYNAAFGKAFAAIYQEQNGTDQGTFKASGTYVIENEEFIKYSMQYLLDQSGIAYNDLLAIMSMETMNWLATSGQITVENRVDAILRMLGYPAGAPLDPDAQERFQYIGTSRLEMTDRVGLAIWKHLNVKLKSGIEIDNHMEKRLINSLGSMAVGVMFEMKDVVGEDMSVREYLGWRNPDTANSETLSTEATVNYIKITPKNENANGSKTEANEELRVAHERVRDIFGKYFGSTPSNKGPVFEMPTKVDSENNPAVLVKDVLYMTQREHEVSKSLMDTKNRFSSNEAYLTGIEGRHSEVDIERWTPASKQRGKRAKNLRDQRDLESLDAFYDKYADTIFYLEHKIRSGRIYMDSFTINTQSSKIHRFMVRMKEWAIEVDTADTTSENYYSFMAAIALGFDIDISLNLFEASKANPDKPTLVNLVDAKIADERIQAALTVLRQDSTKKFSPTEEATIIEAVKFLGVGTHSFATLKTYAEYLNAQEAGTTYINYLPTEVDGKTNGLASLLLQFVPINPIEMAHSINMLRGTALTFEGDSWKNFPEYIDQGGKDNYQNLSLMRGDFMYDMSQGNIQDVAEPRTYPTLSTEGKMRQHVRENGVSAVLASGLLLSIRELRLEDTEAGDKQGKKGRNDSKPILLRVGYSAMIRSIKKALVLDALDAFIDRLAVIGKARVEAGLDLPAKQHAEAIAIEIQKVYDIINVVRRANFATSHYIYHKAGSNDAYEERAPTEELTMTAQEVQRLANQFTKGDLHAFQLQYQLSPKLKAEFSIAMDETYGHATQLALEKMLGGIGKIQAKMIQATQYINLVFTKDFGRRLVQYEELKGKSPNTQQRRDILNQMIREGRVPGIATALSTNVMERLNISKTGMVVLTEKFIDKKDGKEKDRAIVGSAKFKKPVKTGKKRPDTKHPETGEPVVHDGTNSSISTAIKGVNVESDIGVSAIVKAIHATDGAVNSGIFGSFPSFNVHDAHITGTGFTFAAAEAGNKGFPELHAGYSIVQAIWDSFVQAQTLIRLSKSTLTTQDKNEIQNEFYANMIIHAGWQDNAKARYSRDPLTDKWVSIPAVVITSEDKAKAISNWMGELQQTVADNHEGRRQVFSRIRYSNQFAIDRGESHFENGLVASKVPENVTTTVTSQAELVTKLLEPVPHKILLAGVSRILGRKENPVQFILDYLKKTGTPQTATEIFDALLAAYEINGSSATKTLRIINSILTKDVKNVRVRVREIGDTTDYQYAPFNEGMITLPYETTEQNVLENIAQGLIQAMTYRKLLDMRQKDSETFKKLYQEAQTLIEKLKKRDTPQAKRLVEKLTLPLRQEYKNEAGFLAEYLAHVLTQSKENSTVYTQYFAQATTIKETLQILNTVLADEHGNTIYRSSGRPLDLQDFVGKYANKLESDKVQMLFEDLDQIQGAPVNPAENTFLNNVIENFIVKGVRSLEALLINRVISPLSQTNEGAFRPPYIDKNGNKVAGTIYVAAAGNPTTSQTAMSLKEVTAHELVHAIIRAAINASISGESWEIRQEAKRLYDLAKEYVKPEHFLSSPASATQHERDAAQARWDHIFNNPNAQGYHEFVAMAATNYQFAQILSTIDNKKLNTGIADWNLFTMLVNLLSRIVDWIAVHTFRRSTPDVHSAVMALVDDIITINNQALAAVNDAKEGSFVNRWNDKTVQAIAEKFIKKLEAATAGSQEEVLLKSSAGERPGLITAAKAVVSGATTVNTDLFRKNLGEFYKNLHWKKDNALFQLLEEVLPYQDANLKFFDLLRRSKVAIDMKRQAMFEHTRSYLLGVFDPKAKRTTTERNAVTQALMMTDMSALLTGAKAVKSKQIVKFIQDDQLAQTYMDELVKQIDDLLGEQLTKSQAKKLSRQFLHVQGEGLARYMVEKNLATEMQMETAHNIVNQFYLQGTDIKDRIELKNKQEIIELLDKVISLRALQLTDPAIKGHALTVINHEIARDPNNQEDAISSLLAEHSSFKDQSLMVNFDDNPIQTTKGYISEIYDQDVEVQVVPATKFWADKMKEEGYKPAEQNLGRYRFDPNKQGMSMWIRKNALSSYQKSIISLRDQKRAGTGIFISLEQGLQDPNSDGKISAFKAAANFKVILTESSRAAKSAQVIQPNNNDLYMKPVLDDKGNAVDFVYVMSEKNRRLYLKKRSYFDEVLPRMFASMIDKVKSQEMNREVVDALHRDWLEHGEYLDHPGSKQHRFVEISKHSKNPKAREMYRLLPKDTQIHLRAAFKGDQFYLRDDVVNLVLGFRKLSVANNEFLGKSAPIIRLGEKIFQELLQWKRIQIAILNPMVSMGNIISNVLILLTEGIPPKYIMKMGVEALRGIRAYQADIRTVDELEHEIAAARKLGQDVRHRENKKRLLEENIRLNPVGELIDEGLFTSIVAEFGIDEDSWRRQKITQFSEKLGNKISPKITGAGKEIWMLPGSEAFQAALLATQYGDFVARYIKFKYDTEEINQTIDPKVRRDKAINDSLKTFIYYDLPQNEYLQYANDMGFVMFTKFFLRIQPVIAKIFLENPASAMTLIAAQYPLSAPWDENIFNYGGFSGITHKFTWNPLSHIFDPEYVMPSLLKWLQMIGIGN